MIIRFLSIPLVFTLAFMLEGCASNSANNNTANDPLMRRLQSVVKSCKEVVVPAGGLEGHPETTIVGGCTDYLMKTAQQLDDRDNAINAIRNDINRPRDCYFNKDFAGRVSSTCY
jgi:hypothetical protein